MLNYDTISDSGRMEVLKRRAKNLLVTQTSSQNMVAFALRRGRVVSIGQNSYTKTHPQQSLFAKLAGQPKREYLHAEIAALLRAPRDADTLLVVRVNKAGEYVCAKPCCVCSLAISHFNPLLRVIHT